MLVFGPFSAAPKDGSFMIYNLTSPTKFAQELPGLLLFPPSHLTDDGETQKRFDIWYYDHVLSDPIACSSLMNILLSLYDGNNVYICIADYSDSVMNIINESFMKMMQSRYDIKYSIINTPEDLLYVPKDGCDFASVSGIQQFDEDRRRYIQLMEEQKILGRTP